MKRFLHFNIQTHRQWKVSFWLYIFLLLPVFISAQETQIEVYGYLIDERNNQQLKDVLVVNKRTGAFVYGDEEGNYSIKVGRKDEIIFSSLGYSSVTVSLKDSAQKAKYLLIPKLNKYSIIIPEVSINAEREIQEIKQELDYLSKSYYWYEQKEQVEAGQFSHPINALHKRWSKREERRRNISRLKYLDRKKILLFELIQKSKLSETELLSELEQKAFIDDLLNMHHPLLFNSHYELLAYINQACKRWRGMEE